MKLKAIILVSLITVTLNVVSESNFDNQACKDAALAAQLGSGQEVIINLDATEGLEGQIAQSMRDLFPEEKKPVTLWEKFKSFFSFLYQF